MSTFEIISCITAAGSLLVAIVALFKVDKLEKSIKNEIQSKQVLKKNAIKGSVSQTNISNIGGNDVQENRR